jgi:hypothetical protein
VKVRLYGPPMNERRTFVVTVRSAEALTVEDVVRRDIEALTGLEDLPDWIEQRLREEADASPRTPEEEA